MKGIELPVNVLVIVAIAIIVLLGLVFILGIGTTQATWFSKEAELNSACNSMRQNYGQFCEGSDPTSFTVNENRTSVRNLQELCNIQRNCGRVGDISSNAVNCCKKACQCREPSVISPTSTP